MGVFGKKQELEEPGGGGAGLHLDLDERFCVVCRRQLQSWQETCPDDGGRAVRRGELPSTMPPPPAHLLADDDEEDAADDRDDDL
jgi:hypothetical protein